MTKIGMLGAGSWGIALAQLLCNNGHEVKVWSALEQEIYMLQENREHVDKLPGVKLHENMKFTTDLKYAMEDCEILVMAVPSVFTRQTAAQMKAYIAPEQLVVNVSKGIEESTLMTLSEIIEQELPGINVSVLSGPSHAEEVGRGIPTTVVVGNKEKSKAKYIQVIFSSSVFRVYISPDIKGIEVGAALKNVVALAAGMADGLGYGDNTKAALITRGIAEITRVGMAMGGKAETFSGLSGIGDLIVTCSSTHSRNRRAGVLIGQGKSYEEAMAEVKMVVEGVYSAKAGLALAKKYGIEMPLVEQVNEILFNGKKAKDTVDYLMSRHSKAEVSDEEWGE